MMQRIREWLRGFEALRETPPTMDPESFYRALRSGESNVFWAGLEQHLMTNGSFDRRLGQIKGSDGAHGYWYILGYCKAHQDIRNFVQRQRRVDMPAATVKTEVTPRTGGVAKYVGREP